MCICRVSGFSVQVRRRLVLATANWPVLAPSTEWNPDLIQGLLGPNGALFW